MRITKLGNYVTCDLNLWSYMCPKKTNDLMAKCKHTNVLGINYLPFKPALCYHYVLSGVNYDFGIG